LFITISYYIILVYIIYKKRGLDIVEIVKIKTDYITLGQFMKFANLAAGGGDIKALLAMKTIKVDGELENRRGKKLYPGTVVEIEGEGIYRIEHAEN